jgi:hypothetical protein
MRSSARAQVHGALAVPQHGAMSVVLLAPSAMLMVAVSAVASLPLDILVCQCILTVLTAAVACIHLLPLPLRLCLAGHQNAAETLVLEAHALAVPGALLMNTSGIYN